MHGEIKMASREDRCGLGLDVRQMQVSFSFQGDKEAIRFPHQYHSWGSNSRSDGGGGGGSI